MNVSIGDVIDPTTLVSGVALLYVHTVYRNQKIVNVKIKMTAVIDSVPWYCVILMITARHGQRFLLVVFFRVAYHRCGKSDIKIFLTTVFIPICLSRISQSSYNGRPEFQ